MYNPSNPKIDLYLDGVYHASTIGYKFVLPFDRYFDNLDTYLQQIDQEITDGFLVPNNLI